ncbi:hypothetical protein M231_00180 [Tremella mesenterica]|uniref:Mitotic checkpoint regulator, MAD2B-interacting-domain-containing protein n=1 Tax=Tremella mesenterica TaxID=5217 RepID=A0A4Q1BX11_TREME|nr:hypothetical protein M231_00180 [Tremella mesenterica]
MLLANYASESDSESESEVERQSENIPTQTIKTAAKPLPKRKAPIKITLDVPKPTKLTEGEKNEDIVDDDDDDDDDRPDKKKKKGMGSLKGAGSSSLLAMLPAPKRKLPQATGRSSLLVNKSMATKPSSSTSMKAEESRGLVGSQVKEIGDQKGNVTSSISKTEDMKDDSFDLFGLAQSTTSTSSSKPSLKPNSITSAPTVSDFVPPVPTALDPYPGYYQLPSGQWAAYDPDYYSSFFPSSSEIEDKEKESAKTRGEDGRVGRHWDEYDILQDQVVDVDVSEGIRKAREEEERRKLMVKPKLPGNDYDYKAIGQTKGLAAERHQLTSLLNTAFTQREALEERIAQNKKSARLAGTKYGF